MREVTIHDLIQISGPFVRSDDSTAPGDPTPPGTTYVYDDDPDATQLLRVLNDVTFNFPDTDGDDSIFVGATAVIDGTEYTLSAVHEFWGTYTKRGEDGVEFVQQGQTVAIDLVDSDGNTISFLSPSDVFNEHDIVDGQPAWKSGEILSIEIFSPPTQQLAIYERDGVNKLGENKDVVIPCFVAGTMIETPEGCRPVEDLRPGDLVLTRDKGFMAVSWCGQRSLSGADIAKRRDLASIRIAAGALGPNLPERDTRVSPAHRVLICGPRAEILFGESEVLVPAAHLLDLPGVSIDVSAVSYVHIMFETHQIVLGDGMWSESFQPADHSLDGLGQAQRSEIFALFPELAQRSGLKAYCAARMTLKPHEARLLFAA